MEIFTKLCDRNLPDYDIRSSYGRFISFSRSGDQKENKINTFMRYRVAIQFVSF